MKEKQELNGYDGFFSTRLRKLMDEGRVRQHELAEKTETSRQAISQYMDGTSLPNSDKLYRICQYFGVSSDYMLGLSSTPSYDHDIKAVCDTIGLSEKAVNFLIHQSAHYGNEELDYLLSNEEAYAEDESLDENRENFRILDNLYSMLRYKFVAEIDSSAAGKKELFYNIVGSLVDMDSEIAEQADTLKDDQGLSSLHEVAERVLQADFIIELKRAQQSYHDILWNNTIRVIEEGRSRRQKMGNQKRRD